MPNEDAHLCPQSDADLHHEVLRSLPQAKGLTQFERPA